MVAMLYYAAIFYLREVRVVELSPTFSVSSDQLPNSFIYFDFQQPMRDFHQIHLFSLAFHTKHRFQCRLKPEVTHSIYECLIIEAFKATRSAFYTAQLVKSFWDKQEESKRPFGLWNDNISLDSRIMKAPI